MASEGTEDGTGAQVEDLDDGDLTAGDEQLAVISVAGGVGDVPEAREGLHGLVAGRAVDLHAAAARHGKVVRRDGREVDARDRSILLNQHRKLNRIARTKAKVSQLANRLFHDYRKIAGKSANYGRWQAMEIWRRLITIFTLNCFQCRCSLVETLVGSFGKCFWGRTRYSCVISNGRC